MHIRQIPIFQDNYTYLLFSEDDAATAAIDPADPDAVAAALEREGRTLTHILCTHHHWDHTNGNLGLLERFPGAEVIGSAVDAENIPGITRRVAGGDMVSVGALTGRVLMTPCHTRGHVAFLFADALFCGDTLFVGGCGRFFEGEAADMHRSLNEVLAELPGSTRVFCGHEYTVSNLEFAQRLEPDNEAIDRKLEWSRAQRLERRPTVPSTLGEERTYNPFMRVDSPAIQAVVGASDPVEVMARIRQRKNQGL